MKRIYLTSKLQLTPEQRKHLERTCFEITEYGGLPIAPALFVTSFLDLELDSARIMQVCIGLLETCEELWHSGINSEYNLEIGAANRMGILVRYLEPGVVTNDLQRYLLN